MGGIVGSIVGGVASSNSSSKAAKIAKQTAEENNAFAEKMYDKGEALITPEINSGDNAENYINGMLGIGSTTDATNASNAFGNYRDTSGYQFLMDQANNGIEANAAAKGAFQSGATAKALSQYDMNLADTTKNNYITQLTDVANRGTAAKSSLIGQGTNLTNTVTSNNNTASTAAQNNAINQGNIINNTLPNMSSSFGGSALSTLFGI
jgi:hypothetical protein